MAGGEILRFKTAIPGGPDQNYYFYYRPNDKHENLRLTDAMHTDIASPVAVCVDNPRRHTKLAIASLTLTLTLRN